MIQGGRSENVKPDSEPSHQLVGTRAFSSANQWSGGTHGGHGKDQNRSNEDTSHGANPDRWHGTLLLVGG